MEAQVIAKNLVKWRQERGLNQEQLAEAAGLSRSGYRKIEGGEGLARLDTLQRLAEALKVPLKELLEPQLTLQRARFRSRKRLNRREIVLGDVARWLRDFNELESLVGERAPLDALNLSKLRAKLKRIKAAAQELSQWIPEAASAVRKSLKLSEDGPIYNLCGVLESRGVKVLLLNYANEDLMGLSVGEDEGGPAMVVNVWERITVERRIFSAAHELAHLLLHFESYDTVANEEIEREEEEANALASYLLMPKESFERAWEAMSGLRFLDRILVVKRAFRVSWQSVLFRLSAALPKERRGQLWIKFFAEFKQRSGHSLSKKDEPLALQQDDFFAQAPQPGPEPEALTLHDFYEQRLQRLVRLAIEEGEISLGRGAEILHISLAEMRERTLAWSLDKIDETPPGVAGA
jgi:Zn-dependent peptidase ImmA (M78 family)/transcriptional regulator with XRE-family HTH domain